MADQNTSLPVRTEAAGDVIVKIADATITSQQLLVNADGSINVNVAEPVTVDATDLDIRDLTHASDSIKIGDGTDFLAVNNDGSINAVVSATDLDIRNLVFATDKVDVSGSSVTVTATDLDIRDLDFATDSVDVSGSSVTVSATDLDIRDLVFATDKVDVSGSSVTVTATDLDIRDLDAAQDSVEVWLNDASGNPFTTSNPLPVVISSDAPGDEINSYQTNAAVASGATSNHDYTVTALKTLLLSQVWASASGKMKIQIQVETGVATGTFNTRFVGFNSTANPNIDVQLRSPISVAAGVRVRVIRSNLDNQAQDLYSTISGQEV